MFIPGSNPAKAYATGMYEGTLWLGSWNAGKFDWKQVVDFAAMGQGLPLEIYYNKDGTRAFVSTANPGHLNIYDITAPETPKLLHAVKTAGGLEIREVTEECARFLVLHDGHIYAEGTLAELLASKDPYLHEFLFMTLPPW